MAAPMIAQLQVCAAEILNRVKPAYNGTARDRIFSAVLQARAVQKGYLMLN
jgi:hypothetical protein